MTAENTHKVSYGAITEVGESIHAEKYRGTNENFYDAMSRVAAPLSDSDIHRKQFKEILLNQRFMPAGRIQSAIGSPRRVTPYNCFVSGKIEDSFDDIMTMAHEAGKTMRMGGGIGYGFSNLRPRGSLIKSLDSVSSGAVSFMGIFDAVCKTISSSGHRRGAQMAVLRVDHPDIEEFIRSKQNSGVLTDFNISVGITDDFMKAVKDEKPFDLTFEGQVYKTIDAAALWEEIMRSTWDWAEPGVFFLDRVNGDNNLHYCEEIETCNPCGEQPLPAYGACLLGSFNLTKYLSGEEDNWSFDFKKFETDIPAVVRAMDNVVDKAAYPMPQQEAEAKSKRRMGLGITGLANAGEAVGCPYGSEKFIDFQTKVMRTLRDLAYLTSTDLAEEKGSFPLFNAEQYLQGKFIKKLPKPIQDAIARKGMRNSHLLSIAPTGTISLSADNVSSGIEPVFAYSTQRTIQKFDGAVIAEVQDYGYSVLGVKGKETEFVTPAEHLAVLLTAQKYVDSAVSKTCNVGDDTTWDEFKNIYYDAWKGGAKGITTFRAAGKRFGILNKSPDTVACSITGSCE
tara:strand:+ start:802 stop:2496 length:1695 start_codon:yes stop_codon:yes gene_type:complete